MMSPKPLDPPSPLVPEDQVRELLTEALVNVTGGGSATRFGARLGGKYLTPIHGASRVVEVPLSQWSYDLIVKCLQQVLASSPDGDQLVGMVRGGAMAMNPALVQVIWHEDRVHLTAHALEGLIKQRTADKVLDNLEYFLHGGR